MKLRCWWAQSPKKAQDECASWEATHRCQGPFGRPFALRAPCPFPFPFHWCIPSFSPVVFSDPCPFGFASRLTGISFWPSFHHSLVLPWPHLPIFARALLLFPSSSVSSIHTGEDWHLSLSLGYYHFQIRLYHYFEPQDPLVVFLFFFFCLVKQQSTNMCDFNTGLSLAWIPLWDTGPRAVLQHPWPGAGVLLLHLLQHTRPGCPAPLALLSKATLLCSPPFFSLSCLP